MIHPETHQCTLTHGPRPAGDKDKCFYCGVAVGEEHLLGCVLRSRTVIVRATIEYPVVVPEDWDKNMIEFHRNEGSWCSDNMIGELEYLVDGDGGRCLCLVSRFEYVREADESDEDSFPTIKTAVMER